MTTYSKIILTKSGVEQAAPTAGDLDLGELAINYNDGKLFFKDGIDSIRVIGSSGSIISAAAHQDNKSNPHEVNKAQVGLSNVDNTADSAKEVSGPQQSALNLKANQSDTYNKIEVDNLISTQTGSDITLTDLSMGPVAAASGTGGVTYDNLTGVFTYIPPALSDLGGLLASDISVIQEAGVGDETGTLLYDGEGEFTFKKPTLSGLGGIGLSGLSVGVEGTPSGDGSLTYNNTSGTFTYTPPTLAGLGGHLLTDLSVEAEGTPSGNGSLTYDNTSGEFIYDQPTLAGLGGHLLTDLSVGVEGTPAGDGSLTYDNTSGTFTYTPPTLVGLGGGTIATQDSDDVSITGGAILASGGAELTGGGVLGYKSVSPGHYVTQGTDFETAVTINSVAGTINCVANSTYNGNTLHPFIVNNTEVAATDVVVVSIQSETGASNVLSAAVTETTSGSFTISVINTSNNNVDATVILNFAIIKHINPIAV